MIKANWLSPSVHLLVICAGWALAFNVHAQNNSWTGSASGKWETSGNWSAGAPASSNSSDLITNATTKTITLDAATVASGTMTISNLVVSGPSGTTNTVQLTNTTVTALHILNAVTVNAGGALLVTNSTAQVDPSVTARTNVLDGLTTVVAGGVVIMATNSTTFIGSTNGASGVVNISGGSLTIANLRMALATNSSGLMTISGGALLVTNVSTIVGGPGNGEILVTNGVFTTRAMTVGNGPGGPGTLVVNGGSTNSCGLQLAVGMSAGATGSVWVTGGSVLTNTSNSTIGVSGSGTLDLTNSTAVIGGLTVGSQSGSRGTATFVGSTVTLNGALNVIGSANFATGVVAVIGGQLDAITNILAVGLSGDGRLTASNCTLRCGVLYVGLGAGGTLTLQAVNTTVLLNTFLGASVGTGTVWISGGTLAMTNQNAFLGNFGVGRMILSNGTLLAGGLLVGTITGGQGTLTLDGGTASIYSNLVIGDCISNGIGQVILSNGTLAVTNASHTAVLDVRDGTLNISGGTLLVDNLVMTNACGHFVHTGGILSILSMNLAAGLDADGDGIPNGYEQSYGLDPLDPVNVTKDSDGDGLTDLQEYLAGTDPTNSASSFRITSVVRTGSNVLVTWMTGIGKTNALQATAGAGNGSYATNGFVTIFTVTNTVGTVTNYLDVGGATNTPSRYYRVRLVP